MKNVNIRRNKVSKVISWLLICLIVLSLFSMPVSANDGTAIDDSLQISYDSEENSITDEINEEAEDLGSNDLPNTTDNIDSKDEAVEASVNALSLTAQSITISGTFEKKSGQDIATIRYYTNPEKTEYAFAEFSSSGNSYSYSFEAPYDGFTKTQGTSKEDTNATVIAEYYSTTKWDGAVDVTWYNETSTSFNISNPAQLAGLAAIVNGSINNSTPIYKVKGTRADYSKTYSYDTPQTSSDYSISGNSLKEKLENINEGLPTCIRNTYKERTSLIASVQDEAYVGLAQHDFSNKTINITADLDMGGADPSEIDHSKNWSSSTMSGSNYYEDTYPNWTPIGGEYLMDPGDASTMIIASFNGTINGNGHNITNLYCYRWSYRSVGDTAYGYAQGTGLVGMMGSLYDGEENPTVMPALRDMSLSGYIFGRRMVGGFVGCLGGGSNAASGTSVAGGIAFENLVNHAEIHCTDSKGLGGIVACAMVDSGSIINCYNTGNLTADYAAPSGGIVGSNEGMNIYACYNTGKVTAYSSRGRSIGCNNDGNSSVYSVADCYYLEGTNNDPENPGYYRGTASKKVSINTEEMTASQMTSGELLEKLNVNGTAYVAGDDGYPVLYWEKNSNIGNGSLSVSAEGDNSSITATKTGTQKNGTISYLESNPRDGVKCRYYELNGKKLSGNYVTINGINNVITANFEEVVPGTLKLKENDLIDITVTKDGIIKNSDGTTETVDNYPINNGDPLYEGDLLAVKATIKSGNTPEDENLEYVANLPEEFQTQPYAYTFSYRDGSDEIIGSEISSDVKTFTVGNEIAGDEVTLSLSVSLKTTLKMWDHVADTSWYNDTDTTFTITNANELAGLSVLVDEGDNFSGKTIILGNDISLKNNDGTYGERYWNGIGSASGTGFAGTFDGNNKQITDYNGNKNGLFESCVGTSSSSRAVIKNLTLGGKSEGQNACGFIYQAKNTEITNCVSYCEVIGTTSDSSAAIIGKTDNGANSSEMSCIISNCYNYAPITGNGNVGGIVGRLSSASIIEDCINNGNIVSKSITSKIGGLVGDLNGQIYRSGNYGNIRACGTYVGGVAGQSTNSKSVIDSCYNIGTLVFESGSNTNNAVGGILGFASRFNVRNSFNYGEIKIETSATVSKNNIGGTFGRELRNSNSVSENVYYLDTTCAYAEAGTAYEDLDKDASYSAGINIATASEFASTGTGGVLAAINSSDSSSGSEDTVFILNDNAKYPEVAAATGIHVHSGGGEATCSKLPICETCGLEYGMLSDTHGDTKTINAVEAVWNIDGYTGDIVCNDCGITLLKGSTIKADTSATAITVETKNGSNSVSSRNYSIKEFDALKVTGIPLGYSYGTKSKEIMVAAEYVTLSTLLENEGLTLDDIESVDVICGSSKSNISADTLKSCNKYYDSDGKEYSAAATFSNLWSSGSPGDNGDGTITTISDIANGAKNNGTIRFGYGISKEQYDTQASVGGARLVSPVNTVIFNLTETKVLYNGEETNLSNAISQANRYGGTITLQGNLDTGTDGFVINAPNKNVTLDLAGYTISSNSEYCIEVKSGNLTITNGEIKGKVNANTDAGGISVNGDVICDYELEEAYCAPGCVPEYDIDSDQYRIVSKSAVIANQQLNELKRIVAKLTAEKNRLTAKLNLRNVTVKASANATDYKTVEVSWNATSNTVDYEEINFKVQKKENGSWIDVVTSENSYTDVAEPGIKSEYRVAVGLAYEGVSETEYEYGNFVYASVTPTIGKVGISKLSTKSKKLTIAWGNVQGATSYDVYVGTDSGVTKGLVKYTNIKSTKVTTKALKKNKTYYVKVRARYTNSQGKVVYGSWSAAKKIKCK